MLDFPFSVNFKSFPIFCLSYCLALPFFYSSEEVTKSKDCCLMCPETQTEIVNNIINYTYLSGCILDLNRMSTCFLFFSLSLVYLCAGVRRFFFEIVCQNSKWSISKSFIYFYQKKISLEPVGRVREMLALPFARCCLFSVYVVVFTRKLRLSEIENGMESSTTTTNKIKWIKKIVYQNQQSTYEYNDEFWIVKK